MNRYTIHYTHPTGKGQAVIEAPSGEAAVSAWLAHAIKYDGNDWAGELDWEVEEPKGRLMSDWFVNNNLKELIGDE